MGNGESEEQRRQNAALLAEHQRIQQQARDQSGSTDFRSDWGISEDPWQKNTEPFGDKHVARRSEVRPQMAIELDRQFAAAVKGREKEAGDKGRESLSLLGGGVASERKRNILEDGGFQVSSQFQSDLWKERPNIGGNGSKSNSPYAAINEAAEFEENEQRKSILGGADFWLDRPDNYAPTGIGQYGKPLLSDEEALRRNLASASKRDQNLGGSTFKNPHTGSTATRYGGGGVINTRTGYLKQSNP